MALFKSLSVLDALEDLLERERRMILSGSIDDLARLTPEKTRLLSRMAGAAGTAQTFDRVRQKADRNQELLAAVARGVKSVARKLEAMQGVREPLKTYDRTGQARDLSGRTSSFEKRS